MDNKLHFYSILFSFPSGSANTYIGIKDQKITKTRIENAKTAIIEDNRSLIKNPRTMVLGSVSYLGKMTNEEFTGES